MASTSKTHKALTMRKVDGKPGEVWYPLQIQTVPTPTPTASQLLVRPTHLALNHRDLFLRQHLYPAPSFTTPLLADACCTVVSSPACTSSSPTAAPARVLLNPSHGWHTSPLAPEGPFAILGGTSTLPLGCAQEVLAVEAEETVPCPAHLSSAEGAALPLVGLTGWRALVTKSGIIDVKDIGGYGEKIGKAYDGAGKNLLVTGIGGGVALAVLGFAVKMGVRVWVTSGDEGKIEKAKKLGAEGGVAYKEKSWEKTLKPLLPKDRPYLDAVIDGAGGDIVSKAVKLLKPGGTLVSYGMTLAPTLPVPMSAVLSNLDIRGSTMGSRAEFLAMVAFVEKERVRPVVSRVLELVNGWEAEEEVLGGLEALWGDMREGRQFGKLVVAVGGGKEGRDGGGSRL